MLIMHTFSEIQTLSPYFLADFIDNYSKYARLEDSLKCFLISIDSNQFIGIYTTNSLV
jgi:hypothetical protein